LGDEAHKMVMEKIEGLEVPDYLPTSNYVRTGIQIVLQPDDAYFKEFPFDSTAIFTHHIHQPYLYLTEKLGTPFYQEEKTDPMLNQWKLVSFSDTENENWDFTTYQPTTTLSIDDGEVSRSTGCNRFSGVAEYDGSSLQIAKEIMMTKRACPAIDEEVFMDKLQKATSFFVSNDEKSLLL